MSMVSKEPQEGLSSAVHGDRSNHSRKTVSMVVRSYGTLMVKSDS